MPCNARKGLPAPLQNKDSYDVHNLRKPRAANACWRHGVGAATVPSTLPGNRQVWRRTMGP